MIRTTTIKMPRRCRRHPGRPGAWQCERCRFFLCEDCVTVKEVPGIELAMCRCGGRCDAYRAETAITHRQSFHACLAESLAYPFKRSGKYLFLATFGLTALLAFASLFLPFLKLVIQLFALVATSYLWVFLLHVTRRSALDPTEDMDWPDIRSAVDDWLVPFLKACAAIVLYLGPGFFLLVNQYRNVGVIVIFAGLVLLPMVCLSLAMREQLGSLNPWFVVKSIAAVPKDYMLVVGIVFTEYALKLCFQGMLDSWPRVNLILSAIAVLYFSAIQMRLLGHLYRINEERLNWF